MNDSLPHRTPHVFHEDSRAAAALASGIEKASHRELSNKPQIGRRQETIVCPTTAHYYPATSEALP